jgi:Zn-dependent peptidase ImmA (M78 family)
MLAEIAAEELSDCLDEVAMEILDASHVAGPPVDTLAVAGALGITVAVDDRQECRARFVRLRNRGRGRERPTIFLRPEPRLERRYWAVAHEIGEHAAYRVFGKLGIDVREVAPKMREDVSNYLAGRILLPAEWFAADGSACGWDLAELKSRYRTASHELIARRMLEMPPPVIVTIFDNGELYFRRANLPGSVPEPSAVELTSRRAANRHNKPQHATDGSGSVQAWPIHEEGWQREILRTEVEAQFE